jgi:hypothetical protein
MSATYVIGNQILSTVTFKVHSNGVLVDPGDVFLTITPPSGVPVTSQYGVPPPEGGVVITKVDVGIYNAPIDVDVAGDWSRRWYSTSPNKAATPTIYFKVA